MVHHIAVGSYTKEIITLTFDPVAEPTSLEVTSTITAGFHPSWLAAHPLDPKLVFTGLEQADGVVLAVKFNPHGQASVVAEAPSEGGSPCTLLATENEVVVGNYESGNAAIIPTSTSPPYLLPPKQTPVQFQGSGPNVLRQESSHPHDTKLVSRDGYDEVLVPDLGSDKTWRLVKSTDGQWERKGFVEYRPGSGPRHIAVYDNILYTVLELKNEVVAHRLPALPEEPVYLASSSTLVEPPPPYPNTEPFDPFRLGALLAAEILLATPTASFPTPYIYISNRNDASPLGDTIAIFTPISSSTQLELVAEVRTGLRHVRGIAIGGEDGRWLVAGGVYSGGVKVFERIDGGKGLREVAVNADIQRPTGFLWL